MLFTKNKTDNWYWQALNPGGITQLRLRFAKDDNNDFDADFLKLYSGNVIIENRPQLIIEYSLP